MHCLRSYQPTYSFIISWVQFHSLAKLYIKWMFCLSIHLLSLELPTLLRIYLTKNSPNTYCWDGTIYSCMHYWSRNFWWNIWKFCFYTQWCSWMFGMTDCWRTPSQDCSASLRTHTTVSHFLRNDSIEEQFHIPLSEEAFQEYQELQGIIQGIQVQGETRDFWHYIWASSAYSSKQIYNFHSGTLGHPLHSYGSGNPGVPTNFVSFHGFSWWIDWTQELLKRKHFMINGGNYTCALCNNSVEETAYHLSFTCSFSSAFWSKIGLQWQLNLPFYSMLTAKDMLQNPFFMEIFIIAAWRICKQGNALIFQVHPEIPGSHTPTLSS